MMRLTASETILYFFCGCMKLNGKVVSGLGEGNKFFSLEQYEKGFERLLRTKPFFGTLNVDVGAENILICDKIKKRADLVVEGFEQNGRRYFEVKCVRAKLSSVEGLLIFPRLNHHPPNILEFVCAKNLRDSFGFEDEQRVELKL